MRIVITGATGFLGRNTAEKLAEKGNTVFAIVRPGSKNVSLLPNNKNIYTVISELDDLREAEAYIKNAEVWLHFAWSGVNRTDINSKDIQKHNIKNSLNCVLSAKALGCRLFCDAGSRAEYGDVAGTITENTECHPMSEYGNAKFEFYQTATELCKKINLKFFHFRFFSVYGYGDHPWSLVSTLIHDFQLNKDVALGACEHKWNYIYIDDAVNAVSALCTTKAFQRVSEISTIINITGSDTRVLRSFVNDIHLLCEGQGKPVYGLFKENAGSSISVCPDNTLLLNLTKGLWSEHFSFKTGINEIIKKTL